jgi:DNA-binding SARP family transcriptional activator
VKSAFLRFPSLVAATVALGALAVLARFRPEFPETPDSLSSPVTTTSLQALALVAAWLLAALVVVLLFIESLRSVRVRRHANLDGRNVSARMREPPRLRRSGGLHPLDEPRLLVMTPAEERPTQREDQRDGDSSKPAEHANADHDPRPLISLLGPVTIDGGKQSRRGLRARALEVIAFLALRREGAQRDEILEALWPGDDPKRSRQRFYQAVRDARRLLGESVVSDRDRYWLDRAGVRVDVDELAERSAEARRAISDVQSRELLEKALSLFRGEPLAGADYVWAEGHVRSLRATYVELLKRVSDAHLRAGGAQESLQVAERGLAVDVLDEDLWRLALEAEGALGLREAIEDRYGRLREILRDRLALEPSKETRALYLRLLGQR